MASPRRKVRLQMPKLPGADKLRRLRQAAKLSLETLAAQIGAEHGKPIDARHINRIEMGIIRQPTGETLQRILAGLEASYRDRRAVLEGFGYAVPMTLPTEQEINEARRLTAYELGDATYPILLVDLGQRLWAWNRYMPRMISIHPDDDKTKLFFGATLFDVTLNPAFGTNALIANADEFMPLIMHYIKASLFPFRDEAWCKGLVDNARTFPGFNRLWDSLPDEEFERFISRHIVPLNVQTEQFGVLQFRMSTVEFEYDPRFHIIHFTPFGARTLRACAVWAEEERVM